MNAPALLGLIGDLYAQIAELQRENADLHRDITELRQAATTTADP